MGMKIDIDKLTKEKVRFLISLKKPFMIRAGNKGVNVRSDCPGCPRLNDCYDCWLYLCHDDKNRLKINITQKYNNLPNNVLWDVKRGKPKPGEWVLIENEQQIDVFLRQFTGFY